MSALSSLSNFLQRFGGWRSAPAVKRDPFFALCDEFSARVAKWPRTRRRTQASRRALVLVTPWLSTAVPMFALECAAMLVEAGWETETISDATDLLGNVPEPAHGPAVQELISKPGWVSHSPTAVAPKPSAGDVELAAFIVRENAVWRMRGEEQSAEFAERHPNAFEEVVAHLARIRGLLIKLRPDFLLIPGGIFGLSALYTAVAGELGIHFATFDGGGGWLRLCQDGVAAHLADLPGAFEKLRTSDDAWERKRALELGRAELADRMASRDARQFQMTAATGRNDLRFDLLVPLNIRWDSAALGRQRAFDSVAQWLHALLEWVAGQPKLTICIRQHPRERLDFAKGSDRLQEIFAQHTGLGSRLCYVSAEEPLNTYDLLPHAGVVLPHTSTVGIEAALLGRPVVLATHCYYSGFGFCSAAETAADYFEHLGAALVGKRNPSPAQQEDAALAFYLTQRCAVLRTPFTAHPADFAEWKNIPPAELWARPELADFRTALLTGDPLSLVRHRRLCHAD
jgi:hypothetical protein